MKQPRKPQRRKLHWHAVDLWSNLQVLQVGVQLCVKLLQQVVLDARQLGDDHAGRDQVLRTHERLAGEDIMLLLHIETVQGNVSKVHDDEDDVDNDDDDEEVDDDDDDDYDFDDRRDKFVKHAMILHENDNDKQWL